MAGGGVSGVAAQPFVGLHRVPSTILPETAAPVLLSRHAVDRLPETPGLMMAIVACCLGTMPMSAWHRSVRIPVIALTAAWLRRPRLGRLLLLGAQDHSPAAGLMTYERVRPARNPRPAAFFPAACGGSSRRLRFKNAARSGPPLPLRPFGFSRAGRAHHGPPSQGNGPRATSKMETLK